MTLKSLVLRNRDIDYISKYILDNLIKPDFIREDEAFQELLQYLIINGDYTCYDLIRTLTVIYFITKIKKSSFVFKSFIFLNCKSYSLFFNNKNSPLVFRIYKELNSKTN
jgi:hypothetical protein